MLPPCPLLIRPLVCLNGDRFPLPWVKLLLLIQRYLVDRELSAAQAAIQQQEHQAFAADSPVPPFN